jgi:hypothetical protein
MEMTSTQDLASQDVLPILRRVGGAARRNARRGLIGAGSALSWSRSRPFPLSRGWRSGERRDKITQPPKRLKSQKNELKAMLPFSFSWCFMNN